MAKPRGKIPGVDKRVKLTGPLAGLRKHRQAMEKGDPAAGKKQVGKTTPKRSTARKR